MKLSQLVLAAVVALGCGSALALTPAKADVDVIVAGPEVIEWQGPPPYGVYKATYYRRYNYDYGRYWWYYDPYAYSGGYYGYHPRRFRSYSHYGKRYGLRHERRRWRRHHRRW